MSKLVAPEVAPAITEGISPTSTSIRVSWSAPAAEKQNGILLDYVVYYTTDPELPMDMWQMTSAPDTSITLTGLSIFTEYTVSVAAATVAGVGPYDLAAVQTLSGSKSRTHVSSSCTCEVLQTSVCSIACSEPLRVMITDVGEISVSLEWITSAVPNGIIESYLVSGPMLQSFNL